MQHSVNTPKKLRFQRTAFFALSVLWLVSCGKKEVAEPKPDLTKFSGIYAAYLKSCSECHVPSDVAYTQKVGNLDMSTEEAAYTSLLLDADLKRQAGLGCPTLKYVKAGSSAQSLLYAILDVGTADTITTGSDISCKPKYHTRTDGGVANDPTPEQKQAIKTWIDNGAPRN